MAVLTSAEPAYLTLPSGSFSLFALEYEALPSDVLPGPVDPAPCSLLNYRRAWTAAGLRAEDPITWVESTKLDPQLDRDVFDSDQQTCTAGCWAFDQTLVGPDGLRRVAFVEVFDGIALLGRSDGSLARIDGLTVSELCAPQPAGFQAGAWNGQDTVWVGLSKDSLGWLALSEQQPEQPCVLHPVARLPDGLAAQAIAVGDTPKFELFVATATLGGGAGHLHAFDGTRFTAEVSSDLSGGVGGVVRLGPGRALATVDNDALLYLDGTVGKVISLTADGSRDPRISAECVISDGAGGAWVGAARYGPLHFSPPDQLSGSFEDRGLNNVPSVVLMADRVLYSTREGTLGQVPTHGPPCSPTTVFTAVHSETNFIQLRRMHRLDDRRVLVGEAQESDADHTAISYRQVLLERRP